MLVGLAPFQEHQGLYAYETIHTSAMTHPALCHQLLLTLTYFSHLDEQCLVCVFSSVS